MRILKLLFFIFTLLSFAHPSHAQIANDFMVGLSTDLVKTNTDGLFKKTQSGLEVNYYFHRKVTVSGGLEYWSLERDHVSFVIGSRWYPSDVFFVRARGLVGQNDINIGAGWTEPLGEHFKFEAIGDFYFKGDFSIRAGINYVFRQKIVSRE